MFVEGGWKPRREPLPRKLRLTKRQERVLVTIIVLHALLLIIASISGATIIHSVVAL
jgi:hypothetical protein